MRELQDNGDMTLYLKPSFNPSGQKNLPHTGAKIEESSSITKTAPPHRCRLMPVPPPQMIVAVVVVLVAGAFDMEHLNHPLAEPSTSFFAAFDALSTHLAENTQHKVMQ